MLFPPRRSACRSTPFRPVGRKLAMLSPLAPDPQAAFVGVAPCHASGHVFPPQPSAFPFASVLPGLNAGGEETDRRTGCLQPLIAAGLAAQPGPSRGRRQAKAACAALHRASGNKWSSVISLSGQCARAAHPTSRRSVSSFLSSYSPPPPPSFLSPRARVTDPWFRRGLFLLLGLSRPSRLHLPPHHISMQAAWMVSPASR